MPNYLSITGSLVTAEEPSSALMCRVSGYFYDHLGRPLAGMAITIKNIYNPMTVGDLVILGESFRATTDDTGWASIELYRTALVRVEIPGRVSDLVREVTVPDRESITWAAFLFPYVVGISLSESSLELVLGETKQLTATATYVDGEEEEITGYLTWTSSDESVVTVSDGKVIAVGVGRATVSTSDLDTDSLEKYQEPDGDVIGRIDLPMIDYPSVVVVVSS